MFEKKNAEEPGNWQPVEEAQALKELSSCYSNVKEVIDLMRFGGKARTPGAVYRWVYRASVPAATLN